MSNEITMENIIKIITGFIGENEVTYVSTPINTGKRYLDWYVNSGKNLKESEFNNQKEEMVIQPNIRNARLRIEEIRKSTNKIIIDPTTFEILTLNWSQDQFYQFWDKVIKSIISEIIFLDEWEYSLGCCHELLSAIEHNVNIKSQDMERMSIDDAVARINSSMDLYFQYNMLEAGKFKIILEKIKLKSKTLQNDIELMDVTLKAEKLNLLITKDIANIAQFVSFDPNLGFKAKYVHIKNLRSNENLSTKEIIKSLILSAPSRSVNIRSYSPDEMKGNKLIFDKKIDDIDLILEIIKTNTEVGKYTIVNENISIYDAGISGVTLGGIIEFSPEDTPKCVDKEGVCSLPRNIGLKILNNVYGFSPDIHFDSNYRVEFSIHPSRQGVRNEHTIIWEYEKYNNVENDIKVSWPNRFSRFIGDKVFGLLIADALGFMIPKTTVISRKIAPFTFGTETGLKEKWIRTCPIVKEPGKYYTGSNWTDPYKLMAQEEAKGVSEVNIASILSQDAVEALYSGASLIKHNMEDLIEGVAGKGDDFMVGNNGQENLPEYVVNAVKKINNQFKLYYNLIGDVSIEWVYDGENVWIVQLNQLKQHMNCSNDRRTIVQGSPNYYEKVYVKDGLESLRTKIELYKNKNIGVELVGNVGITSHFGDLLRISSIPSILSSQ